MRTKTLLLAAVTLAIGIVCSQADAPVYSQNIVGYVNVPIVAGQYALLANPLDNGTNDLNSLLPTATAGSYVYVWNGTGYDLATKQFNGTWTTNLVIPPGVGFFVHLASNTTNTFVGNVVVTSGSSVTNPLTGGIYTLVGSPIPYADTLSGTNLNLQLAAGSYVYVWNGTGYDLATKQFNGTWTTNLTILPGQGFFVHSAGATNWVQTFPPQQ